MTHDCTAASCGHWTIVMCWRCMRKIARVRQAHMSDALRTHDLEQHSGELRPTQRGAQA